jgi:plastocyanin
MSFPRSMLLAALLAAAACSGDDGDGVQEPDDDTGDVVVRNNSFDPSAFQVEVGGTVTWVWASNGVQHNVTFEDDVASGNQGEGTFQRTFTTAGEFDYLCTIHGAGMSGTITVTAPATDGNGY